MVLTDLSWLGPLKFLSTYRLFSIDTSVSFTYETLRLNLD